MWKFINPFLLFVFAATCMGCTTLDTASATRIARKAAKAACYADNILEGLSGFGIGGVETSSTGNALTITSTQTKIRITVETE